MPGSSLGKSHDEQIAATTRWRRSVDRLDRVRDQLVAEAHLIERETRNGWPIEAATALREAKDLIAEAEDLIEGAMA